MATSPAMNADLARIARADHNYGEAARLYREAALWCPAESRVRDHYLRLARQCEHDAIAAVQTPHRHNDRRTEA